MPAPRDVRLLVLALAAFAFARIAGGTLPWFLFYATFGLVVVAALWAWHIRRNLHCLVALDRDQLEVGQELRVRVRVENEGLLPLPWVEVENGTPDRLVADTSPLAAVSAGVLSTRIIEFNLRARRRGHYPVGPIRLVTGDGLGLFQVRREVVSRHRITVYPRVIPITNLPVPLGQPFGHVRTRQKAFADPSSLAEIRPYRPGDSPRHIHWRTSARRGELHLKEFELNATTQLAIFVDLAAGAHVTGASADTAETGIELAASLAHLAVRRNFELALWAVGGDRHHVPIGRGARTFRQIMAVLARVEANGELPMDRVLRAEAAVLPARATIAAITPALTPALTDTLIRLSASHPVMLVLLKTETFGTSAEGTAGRDPLLQLLAMRHISVYPLGAGDDLRRLAEMRLRPNLIALSPAASAAAGVRAAGEVSPWSSGPR